MVVLYWLTGAIEHAYVKQEVESLLPTESLTFEDDDDDDDDDDGYSMLFFVLIGMVSCLSQTIASGRDSTILVGSSWIARARWIWWFRGDFTPRVFVLRFLNVG